MLYQNMRSVKNKCHLLTSLTNEQTNLHILCLTETWLTYSKLDLLQVDGYLLASSYCRSNREGGGVCILVKEGGDIDFAECSDINVMSIEYIFEVCGIDLPNHNLLIINLYWPDSKRMPDTFYNCLTSLLQLLQKKYSSRDIVIGGDLNVNILDKTTTSSKLLSQMNCFNFYQHVSEPTRVTQTSATCLDLLFTNFKRENSRVQINDYGLSDHKGIHVTIPSKKINTCDNWTLEKRQFNDNNMNNFKEALKQINFCNLFDGTKM
jgi:exonuclease III